MDINFSPYVLSRLGKVNVIIGKNGCGKSTLLKQLDAAMRSDPSYGSIKYISPERGGHLLYEAGIEQNVVNDVNWISGTRRSNQTPQFRQQTMAQYRSLETRSLRALERSVFSNEGAAISFDDTVAKINSLLDNVFIERSSGAVFRILSRNGNVPIAADQISSGEAELISLAIECLAYVQDLEATKTNVLMLDEPDVHLHPDLQARLTRFLKDLVDETNFIVILATHSTAMLAELGAYADGRIALMQSGEKSLSFEPMGEIYQKVLPVFGAHPLSNVFNEKPILLVEGEDDVRIWQQAVRSSTGRINIYPVDCGSITKIHEYEQHVKRIVGAVYDSGKAFSLRDRDMSTGEITDDLPIIRMRLECRAAENLMLSDQVLSLAGTNWNTVREHIDTWLSQTPVHPQKTFIEAFRESGYDRKGADLKEIRMLLIGQMIGSTKPWEVLVGQAIGQGELGNGEGSLADFLSSKAVLSLSLTV